MAELANSMQALLATVKNGKGLRIDGTIRHPTSCEDIWFDVSAIHTTGPTRIRAEVKLTRQRQAAGKDGARMQSAALSARTTENWIATRCCPRWWSAK